MSILLQQTKREFELKADFENRLSYRKIDGDTGTKQSVIPEISKKLSGIQEVEGLNILDSRLHENDNVFFNSNNSQLSIFDSVFADSSNTGTVCYINGNYNGLVAKTNDGTQEVILAVPSLILSDTSKVENTTFTGGNIDKLGSGILQCNGNNTPCVMNYNSQVVWSGSIKPTDYPTLLANIQNAYSGSNITSQTAIQNILISTGTSNIDNFIGGIIKSIGVTIVIPSGNCASPNPTFENIGNLSFGNPEIKNQDWNYASNPSNCTYDCKNGYIGTGCSTLASCNGSIIINNAIITNNVGLTVDMPYQTTIPANKCYYTCKPYYSGINCEIYTPPAVGTNISTVPGETILYAGDYKGRIIWVAGTSTKPLWQNPRYFISNASNEENGILNTGLNNINYRSLISGTRNTGLPAGDYCANLNRGGYSDWYLPAAANVNATTSNCSDQLGEMQFLYCKHRGTGSQSLLNFLTEIYWSSTQYTDRAAMVMNLETGVRAADDKDAAYYNAVCIRQSN
ncbi:MAG: hypothetical protein PHZ26_00580 [Candidatus Gracilibacteria bacterium]|nr:hypothetical protein [Candidatus Gracilibacteria bacterium]MDD2908232.1 hypothetical protein [Candidatus Gracilibacteria bacterium]